MHEARKIEDIELQEKMKEAYLDYSMSVIVGRAIPDVRDGLKPVHRRILYAMWDMGLKHTQAYKKSARVVGDVLGKYHPHGDQAVYDALVRMAQDFSLRYPLVDGQGNFGSLDGDSPAAMRYCVTGDTLVPTDQGNLPIGKISDGLETDIDLKVTNYQGKEVDAEKYFDSGYHETIKIRTEQDYELEGSRNHPILCWTKEENSKPSIEWKVAEEIEEGDIAIINRTAQASGISGLDLSTYHPEKSSYKEVKLPEEMSNDLAFLLGIFVSDASLEKEKITFSTQEPGLYNKIKNILLTQFKGIELSEKQIQGKNEVTISQKKVIDFFKDIGLKETKSREKQIPFTILLSDKDILQQFIKGLFEKNGSIALNSEKIEVKYSSASEELLKQLKTLLLNFNIITTDYHENNYNSTYELALSGYENVKRFYEEIGFYTNKKQVKLKKIEEIENEELSRFDYIPFLSDYLRKKYDNTYIKTHDLDRYNQLQKYKEKIFEIIDKEDQELINKLLNREYFFSEITSVKSSEEQKRVYSLRVNSNCHSFMANGFINHNTECRLTRVAEEMLYDMDKDTVDFRDNFDGSMQEPVVLPSKAPNLLINGSSGIAVGMATNIPPHNLSEVIDALITYIEEPDPELNKLMNELKGPDFPTGGEIIGRTGIKKAYATGKGKVTNRALVDILREDNRIVVNEVPFNVKKSKIVEQIADLVKENKLEGIRDLRDESDREGLRIVVDLKKKANADVVLNKLYKKTSLEKTFGITNLAIVDGEPELLTLKEILEEFVEHRVSVVKRRTNYLLEKAENRIHILNGLLIALENIDDVVELIQGSEDRDNAREKLIQDYSLSQDQADAILKMRLQRLTGLEKQKLKNEHESVSKDIEEYKEILSSRENILEVVKEEFKEIKEKYSDERRTKIRESEEEIDEIDLITKEETVVSITKNGYIKRTSLEDFRKQNRGGRGLISMNVLEEDAIIQTKIVSTHDYLLFFTNKGNIYWLRTYRVPEYSRRSQGRPIINYLELDENEEIHSLTSLSSLDKGHDLLFATKQGKIKRTKIEEYSNPRPSGIIAIKLEPNDELVDVKELKENQDILLLNSNGNLIRFDEKEVKKQGRNTMGVKSMSLDKQEEIKALETAKKTKKALPITTKGYGKQTPITEFRKTHRAGKGVKAIKSTPKNGEPIDLTTTEKETELFLTTKKGYGIRTTTESISEQGRNTMGVKLIDLKENDKLIDIEKIKK